MTVGPAAVMRGRKRQARRGGRLPGRTAHIPAHADESAAAAPDSMTTNRLSPPPLLFDGLGTLPPRDRESATSVGD
jgi:hypothetical protein